jgi:SAM-dependent methyltransferase
MAEDLYERSQSSQYVNAILGAAVAAFAASSARPLRILEIGVGTGAGTASVLPLLDRNHIYTLSDVSDVFLSFAREKFAGFENVRFARFDLDREIADQDCVEAQFDMIISVNAVHASANLQASLARLERLLAPGGLLALVESTTGFAWFDFTTGLIEGWRQHMDTLRKDGPLLGAAAWTEALRESGFVDASHFPEAGAAADILGQHLILARKAGEQSSVAAAPWSIAAEKTQAPAHAEQQGAVSVVQELARAAPVERIDIMRAFVRGHVRAVLGLTEEGAPERRARLTDLGFDSLMAVQLRNRLTRGLGLEKPLPASMMFDHPTVEALSSALLKTAVSPSAAPVSVSERPPEVVSADTVAVMSDADIAALLEKRMERRQ